MDSHRTHTWKHGKLYFQGVFIFWSFKHKVTGMIPLSTFGGDVAYWHDSRLVAGSLSNPIYQKVDLN
ncbi:hypothetical protein FRX31_024521 [Thalictrum thalictroides]|uniref:Uncharacterized protein n=1 Tax=Thalictrum thalictroides TaxID=46969 RepID=A0A7J6VNZ8_THATH|nr:hypothetical protein FRX31_024521 [Thalictrum thalictroides]